MEYKYELHCHTKEVSLCGRVPVRDIIEMYKDKGYSGIVLTDHYSPMTFYRPSMLFCPQKHVDFYTSAYREALKYANDDFTVLLGMELRYYATANDFLVYGITEEFLRKNGNLMTMYPKNFYRLAKRYGYIVLQAHPFRSGMVRINPKYLDGAEVYNGKTNREQNLLARQWAQKNHMSITVSGSDFHRPEHLAKGGIITETPIKTNGDLLAVLRSGNYKLIES
ncbi:MAG: PHP domain-containing protein [Clostridiales bacterium]|nr:PHP domain-containing protein [Clostridiales bacterium]